MAKKRDLLKLKGKLGHIKYEKSVTRGAISSI